MQTKNGLECYKQNLKGNIDGSSKDQNANRIVKSKNCPNKVSNNRMKTLVKWT